MARRLNTYVHVDGVEYGPEVDVPDEVAERITAPGVWVDPPKAPSAPKQTAATKPAAEKAAAEKAAAEKAAAEKAAAEKAAAEKPATDSKS